MQKKVFTFSLEVNETNMFEKMLNIYQISLNERDRSKVFIIGDVEFVCYIVICDDLTAQSLTHAINQYRIKNS